MQQRLLGLLAAPVLVLALTSCGSGSDATASDPATAPPTSAASPVETVPGEGYGSGTGTPSAVVPPVSTPSTPVTSTKPAAGAVSCTYPADGQAAKAADAPPTTAAYTGKVQGVISTTSGGDLHITLNGDTTPCAVNSFVSLANQGYYDNTPCHRLTNVPMFEVLQCGDPSGTGSGGPGYRFKDELTGSETYPAGTLAMANAGPDTNGSQFFVCYGDTQLAPSYDVFGSIDLKDLAGVKAIGAKGSDNSNGQGDGKPLTPISITGVTIG